MVIAKFASCLQAVLLVAGLGMAAAKGAGKNKSGSSAASVPDRPEGIVIIPLDSAPPKLPRERIRLVPLPEHTRLKEGLIHPDTLRKRVEKGYFRLEKGDLIPDTLDPKSGLSRPEAVSREFADYWKKVESTGGFQKYRKQMLASGSLEESWVPKVMLFDSTVVVIPGYIFLRF